MLVLNAETKVDMKNHVESIKRINNVQLLPMPCADRKNPPHFTFISTMLYDIMAETSFVYTGCD